jgi:hypothetical protein
VPKRVPLSAPQRALLEEALAAFREALTEQTRENAPGPQALSQAGVGTILMTLTAIQEEPDVQGSLRAMARAG